MEHIFIIVISHVWQKYKYRQTVVLVCRFTHRFDDGITSTFPSMRSNRWHIKSEACSSWHDIVVNNMKCTFVCISTLYSLAPSSSTDKQTLYDNSSSERPISSYINIYTFHLAHSNKMNCSEYHKSVMYVGHARSNSIEAHSLYIYKISSQIFEKLKNINMKCCRRQWTP